MEDKKIVEVIEFTDPACTWCWGSEPILRKLETLYEGSMEVNYIMGGLVKDIRNFRDDLNNIGGDTSDVNAQVASHWLEASERHGMPVEPKGFSLFSEDTPSTYPMNIAYKAAQFQSEVLAKKFLRRIREAVETEASKANQIEVLIELAGECGIDIAKFIKSFSDGTAEKAFEEDLKVTGSYRVHGFPSFLVKSSEGKGIMLRGYQSFDTFKAVIDQITNGELAPKKIEKTEENIMSFIKKFERVATFEISTVFDLSKAEDKPIFLSIGYS
ncbi:MAG: oxidoreductase [Clostridiales bacterium]|jgi:predicted DsbA family dithiol-disulfide isomerase|nr:oxidoreductase [Clostridiales bacterium]